jgi:hypothetical protein
MQVSEPSLEILKQIRDQLFVSPSTDENMKRLRAIELQIARHEPKKEPTAR